MNSATPVLVSVIIPAKGRTDYVKEALNSILSQKGINKNQIQTIVIEDDKRAEISKLLRPFYPEVNFVLNTDKEGPGGGRNTGLEMAKGKYISFLDSDDRWKPTFLYDSIKSLEQYNDAQGVWCYSQPIFEGSFTTKEKLKLSCLCLIRDLFQTFFYLFNKKLLPNTGFYLPQISHLLFKAESVKKYRFNYTYRRGGEDWAFFATVLQQGKIVISPKKLVLFRYSKGSSTMSKINQKLKWKSYSYVLDDLPNSFKKGILYKLFLEYIKQFSK